MKFKTNGLNSINQDVAMKEAAEIYANRLARKTYGKRGFARTLNMTSWSEDGSVAEFSSFIGKQSDSNETTGHNINFTVFKV